MANFFPFFSLLCFACELLQGRYYKWDTVIDETSPCALDCRAGQRPHLVVRMDDKVIDGTRCRKDSLDMCIDGQCQVSAAYR